MNQHTNPDKPIQVNYHLVHTLYFGHPGTEAYAGWLGSLVVKASDLRLKGREFDHRPPHYRSVGTAIGDRLRADIPI